MFLSRYDKSATNIKESLLFAEIGQVRNVLISTACSRALLSNFLMLRPVPAVKHKEGRRGKGGRTYVGIIP